MISFLLIVKLIFCFLFLDAKLKNIDEVLNYIEERLDELKQERDDLTRYIEVDRDRRCLEYAIYDKQLNEAKSKLKEVFFLLHLFIFIYYLF